MLTDDKMRLKLLMYIKEKYGSQKDAAAEWGLTAIHVSRMVTGRSLISDLILDEMGYEKVKLVTYQKK